MISHRGKYCIYEYFAARWLTFWRKKAPAGAAKTSAEFSRQHMSGFPRHSCKDTVASLNRAAVRALEAFVAAKRVEFRGASNGNTPGTPKFTKKIENGCKSQQIPKHRVLLCFLYYQTPHSYQHMLGLS